MCRMREGRDNPVSVQQKHDIELCSFEKEEEVKQADSM
jgi:hypothetical protein